jgi:hypothetical protein
MHRLWLDEMLMVDIRIGVKAFVEKVWTTCMTVLFT